MFDISRAFTVEVPGRGAIRLGPGDHVASGGEGHVYKAGAAMAPGGAKRSPGGLAIKIWDDPDRAARDRMPDKIKLLAAALAHPWIVAPRAPALDSGGRAIGYAMDWVEADWALPQAFTNDWRGANRFGDAEALAFAAKMREVVLFAHSKGAVLGDANELNILAVGSEPRYIDVDPWGLPGYPGDKVLPTIRDWHAPPFTREADWFAWGVVTFQLLVGVHPYRGAHPGFGRHDLEGRMKANASVLDGGARVPSPATRSFASIPGPLLDWYRATFRDGRRDAPPVPDGSPAMSTPAPRRHRASGAGLIVSERFALASPALRMAAPDILLLRNGLLVSLADGRAFGSANPDASFVRLPDGSVGGLAAVGGALRVGALSAAPGAAMAFRDAGLAARRAWSAENRLFAASRDGLLEIEIRDLGARRAALPGRKWSLNPDSTAFGDGMAVYDALGARFLVAPFGARGVAMLRCRELDGLKPIAMVRRGRVGAMSLIDKSGSYKRATLVFAEDYGSCRVALSDADDGSLTDAVTDGGVIARFTPEGRLELTMPVAGAAREADPAESSTAGLLAGPSGVFCAVAGKMFKLSLS